MGLARNQHERQSLVIAARARDLETRRVRVPNHAGITQFLPTLSNGLETWVLIAWLVLTSCLTSHDWCPTSLPFGRLSMTNRWSGSIRVDHFVCVGVIRLGRGESPKLYLRKSTIHVPFAGRANYDDYGVVFD